MGVRPHTDSCSSGAFARHGWWNMHHIVRTSYTVYTRKLYGRRATGLLFFSDLHYGTTMNAEALQSICLQIEQERPDILVVDRVVISSMSTLPARR